MESLATLDDTGTLISPEEFKKNMLKTHFAKHFDNQHFELPSTIPPGDTAGARDDASAPPKLASNGEVIELVQHEPDPSEVGLVNYASKDAGAVLLNSLKAAKGSANVLVSDADKYALVECDSGKGLFFVVQLSEEVRGVVLLCFGTVLLLCCVMLCCCAVVLYAVGGC